MILTTSPTDWNSPYYPVEFIFDYYRATFTGVTDTGGNATLTFSASLPTKFIQGGKVYIESGAYEGLWTIETVVSQTQIVIDADYAGNTTAVCRNIVTPQFLLYKGYLSTEEYPIELPITLVADLGTPEYDLDYQVTINVAGYLQRIFAIQPPTDGIDFAMFNKFRLFAIYTTAQQNSVSPLIIYPPKKVVNAAIPSEDLMAYYLNGIPLTSNQPAIVFDCDKTIISRLGDVFVNNEVFEGINTGGDYNNDYSSDFYI